MQLACVFKKDNEPIRSISGVYADESHRPLSTSWVAVPLLVLDLAVDGNGTARASSKSAYTYFRIDTAATPGYLTSAWRDVIPAIVFR